MATPNTEPKQTKNQGADGRKDERKGVDPGRDIEDQGDLANAQGAGDSGDGQDTAAKSHRNSQGGEWGKNRGKGGNDAGNKR
jgi:hypothetical protein